MTSSAQGQVQHINPETLHANPAFTNVITVTGPVRTVYVGGQDAVDAVVPPSFSEQLAAQLQNAGAHVTYHAYPGADHNLSPDTAAAMAEAIAFFDQYLK